MWVFVAALRGLGSDKRKLGELLMDSINVDVLIVGSGALTAAITGE